MTIAKGFALQQAVFAAVEAALPGVQVFAFQPDGPPARWCRIDGFTLAPVESFKNHERADHALTVHVFDGPPGGTASLQWVRERCAAVHAALNGLALDGASHGLRMSAAGAAIETRGDGVRDAHAFIRYNAIIGE